MTESPKIILDSELTIVENGVDANKLFEDLELITQETKQRLMWKRLPRYFTPQTILNRTSGGYIAPTSAKSFENSPASYLYSMTIPDDKTQATYVGTSFHDVMEKFYLLKPEYRTKEEFEKIRDKIRERDSLEGRQSDELDIYCEGFWTAGDYLPDADGNRREMNHAAIKAKLEYFITDSLSPLGINLSKDPENLPSVPTYTKIDRIDFRTVNGKEEVYVIDYKTGMGNAPSRNLGAEGYLPQMIFYKWAVEAALGVPVAGVYMMCPGAKTDDMKWIKMNVDSLEEQSKVIENVVFHLKHIAEIRESRIYPENVKHWNHPLGKNYYKSLIYRSQLPKDENGESLPVGTKLPIYMEFSERELLEHALETEMITELPDNIYTLEDWVTFSKEHNHAFEEDYILNQEALEAKQYIQMMDNLAGETEEDDEDW